MSRRSAGICLNEQTGRYHTWIATETPGAKTISRRSYATYDEVVRAFRGERKRRAKG